MLILGVLVAMLAAGIWLSNTGYCDWRELAGIIFTATGGIPLFIALLAFPVEYLGTRGQIVEFHSLRATLEAARIRDPKSIENAAFQVKIADANQWLASKQYWNRTHFDIWIPDAVDTLQPIR